MGYGNQYSVGYLSHPVDNISITHDKSYCANQCNKIVDCVNFYYHEEDHELPCLFFKATTPVVNRENKELYFCTKSKNDFKFSYSF